MKQRGYTLIELMITVALIGIGGTVILHNLTPYQKAATRTFQYEGVARVLDSEMERIRACSDRQCIRALDTRSATVAATHESSLSWVRASIRRTMKRGPDGTTHVRLEVTPPGRGPTQHLEALIGVAR